MSWTKFDDECEGCRPAIIDGFTGKPMPMDSAPMVAINVVWSETTIEERQAFHRVCCLNSRDPDDLAVIGRLQERFKKAVMAA